MNLFGSKTQTLSMVPEVAAYSQQNSQQFSSIHQTGGCQNLIQTPKQQCSVGVAFIQYLVHWNDLKT
jgi:hypothetical protein